MELRILCVPGWGMKNVIVLIGAPATGKSTLALKLSKAMGGEVFSFDELFPLEKFTDSSGELRSKDARAQLVQRIQESANSCCIVDDTNHLHSMQKRYLGIRNAKVLFIYLRAERDQIKLLFERNSMRKTAVTLTDIDRIAKHLLEEPPIVKNLLTFDFSEASAISSDLVLSALIKISPRTFPTSTGQVLNAKHELNNLLTERIHSAFQQNKELDGKLISKHKRDFLASAEGICFENLTELVEQFAEKYL